MGIKIDSKLFGLPLFGGRGKKRVILKHLRRRWSPEEWEWFRQFENYSVGDVVNDCSSFNGQIKQIDGDYFRAFKGSRFQVLWDVSLLTSNTSASLRHCGIEPKLPREEVVRRIEEFRRNHPGWSGASVDAGKEVGPEGEMVPPNNS